MPAIMLGAILHFCLALPLNVVPKSFCRNSMQFLNNFEISAGCCHRQGWIHKQEPLTSFSIWLSAAVHP